MIPKYPFYVEVQYKNGPNRRRETKNFESLLTAVRYAEAITKKPDVSSATISVRMFEYTSNGLLKFETVGGINARG